MKGGAMDDLKQVLLKAIDEQFTLLGGNRKYHLIIYLQCI